MKRSILIQSILVFFFFAMQQAFAQNTHSYGIKGGTTFTTLSNHGSWNIKPGLQAGAFAKLAGGEQLFFKAEFLATQKGAWNWNRSQPDNFSLYYFDLPIMFGIEINRNLSINLGIQPSVLLAGTYKFPTTTGNETRSIGSDIARFDYSLLIGAEYFIKEDMFLGLRYSHAFVPLQNLIGEFTIQNQNQLLSNRVVQFYLGYVIK
ncbi:MAG: porin family protein [Cytophagaceae bacterium]